MGVFGNQDWVWGVGLMLSGLFFAIAVLKYGVTRWRETFINTGDSDIHVGAWWDWLIRFVVVEALVLIGWFLWGARGGSFEETWTLFSSYNVGTVIIQSAIVLIILMVVNLTVLNRRVQRHSALASQPDSEAHGAP
jgi:neurotransmitter:Na+ symporter, NSS family